MGELERLKTMLFKLTYKQFEDYTRTNNDMVDKKNHAFMILFEFIIGMGLESEYQNWKQEYLEEA